MTIELNHTIVPARDKEKSAQFFVDIFGLEHEGSSGRPTAQPDVREAEAWGLERPKEVQPYDADPW